jgi:hypothetical protein
MLPTKKILFPSSFWGIFDFFVNKTHNGNMWLIKHIMVTSFDVSLMSPEKVSSVVFHI